MRLVQLVLATIIAAGAADVAVAQKPPPPSAIAPGQTQPRIVNNKLDMSFCEYPAPALRQDIEGCCRMKVNVSIDGKAGRMSGECTHDIFLEPSKVCLAPQAFLPATRKGKPVRATGEVVVEYRISSGDTPPVITFLEKVFPSLKKPRKPREEDDICKRRPDDLIAGLERLRGG